MAGEWRVESFPDVIDFQEGPGILAKDFREEGIPLVRLAGLDRGGSVLAGCNYLDPETVAKRWSHFALAEGDMLLSTSASLGRIAVVGSDGVGAIPYTGIIRMRPLDARLTAPFIRYLLEGPDFQQQAEMVGAGSVIRHFGPTHLRQMSVRLPPPEEQRAIAHILGTLDDKIELNRRMSETLEAMARALFKSWFVDFDPVRAKAEGRDPGLPKPLADLFPDSFEGSELGEIPKGWRASVLGDEVMRCGGRIQTGPFGSQLHASDYVDDGVPVVMPKDLSQRRVSTLSIAKVNLSDVERLSRHRLQEGDIVYSRRGDVEQHGLVRSRETGWLCGTGCLLVRFGPEWLSPLFASFALDRPETRAWITQHAIGATMPNLNTGILACAPIIVPSNKVLAAFNRVAQPLADGVISGDTQAETLVSLRDALLPKLISGELGVKDAEKFIDRVM